MNGNSYIFIFIFIFIYSCGSSKKANKNKVPVETFTSSKNTKKNLDSIITARQKDSIALIKSAIEKIEKDPFHVLENTIPKKKFEYTILGILPFNAGEIWKLDMSKVDNIIPKEPKQTLQFFEGMYLAIQEYTHGPKINLILFDNRKQDSTTENILQKIDLLNPPDLIIAPFHTRQAQIVANFAKKNKIPCFLPYNPSEKISNNNPYLFKTNPSLISIYKKIISEILESADSSKQKIHFVFKDNLKGEADIAKTIEKFTYSKIDTAQIRPDLDPKKINFIVTNKGMRVMENLIRQRKNIFLIPSADDKFINLVIAALKPSNDYSYEIYGIPSWERSELLDLKNLENKNTMIFTDYYIGSDSAKFIALNKKYFKLYDEEINDDVIKGYDFMNFLATNLEKYGNNLPFNIQRETYQGIGSSFLFKPVIDKKGNIDNYENMNQFKLILKDEKWILYDSK